MATKSASAPKGKRAGAKRGHPPAANDCTDVVKLEPVDTDDSDATTSPPAPKGKRAGAKRGHPPAANDSTDVVKLEPVDTEDSDATTSPPTPKKRRGSTTSINRDVKKERKDNTKSHNNNKSDREDWSSEDLSQLIENLITLLPKTDNVKYTSGAEKLDWSKVCVSDYSAEECKDKWNGIITKLRRYRTLSELAFDAREWIKHPWIVHSTSRKKQKHPELPKKPATAYFGFCREERERCRLDNPGLSMTDISKVLYQKYTELTDKKKQGYRDNYDKDLVIYRAEMKKFREEHPEMFPETKSRQSKQNGPHKAQSAIQLFLAEKMLKHGNEVGRVNKKEMEDEYRNQFKNLSDTKRVKWINKALADETRFATELADYRSKHPECTNPDPKKSLISKAERKLKDQIDGRPDRPPNSGYSLFSMVMMKELKDVPSKERMSEISRLWKELSEGERQGYGTQAQDAIVRYHQDLKVFVSNLPEDERKKLEVEEKKKRTKKPASAQSEAAAAQTTNSESLTPSRPMKPLSAPIFYQQEKMAQYKAKHPDISEQALIRLIARKYAELSEKKREKYKKMAEDAKKMYDGQTASDKESEIKNKIIKSEPKKPAQSGYSLYTAELMSTLTDIEPRSRMGEISKRWNANSSAEKEKYKSKAADLNKKYLKELNRFLTTLTDEEKKIYLQLKEKKPRRTKGKQPVVTAEKVASSSSSDEEENGKADEESSSSDSGSGGGSDNDPSSESDASGSGSDNEDDDNNTKKESANSESDDSDDDNNTKKEPANSESDDSDDESSSNSDSE